MAAAIHQLPATSPPPLQHLFWFTAKWVLRVIPILEVKQTTLKKAGVIWIYCPSGGAKWLLTGAIARRESHLTKVCKSEWKHSLISYSASLQFCFEVLPAAKAFCIMIAPCVQQRGEEYPTFPLFALKKRSTLNPPVPRNNLFLGSRPSEFKHRGRERESGQFVRRAVSQALVRCLVACQANQQSQDMRWSLLFSYFKCLFHRYCELNLGALIESEMGKETKEGRWRLMADCSHVYAKLVLMFFLNRAVMVVSASGQPHILHCLYVSCVPTCSCMSMIIEQTHVWGSDKRWEGRVY